MGKSNRIRSEKYQSKANSTALKNQKKGTPSWLYPAILSVVAVFVAVIFVFSVFSSSGIAMRHTKAISSDNYTINGNMLSYMFMTEYQQFQSDNQSIASYIGLDASKSLKDQEFSSTAASLFGAFEGSWYDYFMNSVKTQAEQLLIYCEEADARGIALDDTDKAQIDLTIEQLKLMASMYGYSTDAYLALSFGNGVKVKDIRGFLEISALAAKCATVVDEDIIDGITDAEISAKYEANKKNYNVVDYVYYGVYVDFENVTYDVIADYDGKTALTSEQEALVLEEYKKQIEEAKAKADVFKTYTTVEEFTAAMLRDVADTEFDNLYEKEALKDTDKLSDEALSEIKSAMITKVLEEVNAGAKETADETGELDGKFIAYGHELTENAAKAVDNIKNSLFNVVNNSEDTYTVDKVRYDEASDVSKWMFDETTAIGATHVEMVGDGSEGTEIKKDKGYFDVSVYMLKTKEYCDKTLARNVGYMTFDTEAKAKAAIESLKTSATKDKAALESVATAGAATTNGVLENYLEGALSYNGFEDWLYAETTVVGSYTETPLANAATDATEWAVFLYIEDGDEAWFIDVQASIYVEDYDAFYKAATEKYTVTVNDKALNKIDA